MNKLFKNRVKRNIGLVGLLTAAVIGFAREGRSQTPLPEIHGVVPAAASNKGKEGTYWHTMLWASQDKIAEATLVLYAGNLQHPAQATEAVRMPVPQGRVVTLDDALQQFPKITPPGALFYAWEGIVPEQGVVFSRTYTAAPNNKPGTLGQGVPGINVETLPSTPQIVPLHWDFWSVLSTGEMVPTYFRSNLGLANPETATQEIHLNIRNWDGIIQKETSVVLPPLSWTQINSVLPTLGVEYCRGPPYPAGNKDSGCYVEALSETGKFAFYSSIIDNKTGDPTQMSGSAATATIFPPIGTPIQVIPFAAHLAGANDTLWRTDIQTINYQSKGADHWKRFLKENVDGSVRPNVGATWQEAYAQEYAKDLVIVFSSRDTKGALVYDRPMKAIFSRTYNYQGADGTYGQECPALEYGANAITPTKKGVMIGLSNNADYRTNVGFVNYHPSPATITVALYKDDGTLLGNVQQEIKGTSMTQIDKIFEKITTSPIANGRAVVTATSAAKDFYGILTYASVVDNATGDPTTVLAKIMPK